MADNGVLNILARAEQCLDLGQVKMARIGLDEIFCRLDDGAEVDEATYERISSLEEDLDESAPIQEADTSSEDDVCDKCNGRKTFANTGLPCYACKGKGFQTDSDRARNKAYWNHRRNTARSSSAEPNRF